LWYNLFYSWKCVLRVNKTKKQIKQISVTHSRYSFILFLFWQHVQQLNCTHEYRPTAQLYARVPSNSSTVRTSTVQHILWDISPLYLPHSNTTIHSGQYTHTGVHTCHIGTESTYCYIRARPTKHELKNLPKKRKRRTLHIYSMTRLTPRSCDLADNIRYVMLL
jgi:hypothetical protein